MPPMRVCIGFDFGTSTTKVAVRRDNGPATVCAVEPQHGKPLWFATPSLVRIVGDQLRFGVGARDSKQGTLLENLKVAFLGKPTIGPTSQLTPDEVDAYVTAYLCWALGRIRERLDRFFCSLKTPISYTPTLHIGAPMSYVDLEANGMLLTRYRRAAHAAFRLGMTRDLPLEPQREPWIKARARIERALAEPLPPEGERRFHVSPETLAPFVSLLQQQQLDRGFHMLVDVGAATTEVAIVWLKHSTEEGHTFVPYYDATALVGGNNFPTKAPQAEIDTPTKQFEAHLRKSLYQAVLRDRNFLTHEHPDSLRALQQRWASMPLWKSGGGLTYGNGFGNRRIHDALHKQEWRKAALFDFPCAVVPNRHIPSGQDLRLAINADFGSGPRTHFDFLAVAHGLSLPWPQWPGWGYSPPESFNPEAPPWNRPRFTPTVDWPGQ